MAWTQEKNDRYVKHDGVNCAECEVSYQLKADTPEILTEDIIIVPVVCRSCGAEYNDVYELTGYDMVEITPMTPNPRKEEEL